MRNNKANEIINKTDDMLKKIFARVEVHEPYYTLLRALQQDIYKYKTDKDNANRMRQKGMSIRKIAKELGYKHPGSISYLLKAQ